MKKLAIIGMSVAAVLAASTLSAAEVEYYTNAVEKAQRTLENGWPYYPGNLSKINPSDFAAVDDILSSCTQNVRVISSNFPKSTRKFLDAHKEFCPGWCKYVEARHLENDPQARAYLPYIIDGIYLPNAGARWLKYVKGCALQSAATSVKAQIRKEGKSFVAKEGYNPVQDRLDALSKALDAPRMAGAVEAFAACGMPNYPLDMTKCFPPDEELAVLKEDIFYGRKPFNDRNQLLMMVYLGVEGFNKFVEEYNN